MWKYISLSLVIAMGCANPTSSVEPSFGKSKVTITEETMTGNVSLGKVINKTISDPDYCKITVSLSGMIPNQVYTMNGTTAVTGYGGAASNQGTWTASIYVLKSELPLLKMYRVNADYSLTTLTPDYPLLQHPDITLTNRCY